MGDKISLWCFLEN